MKNNEPLSEPPPIRITFAVWRRAPLAWSAYWIGRFLHLRGTALSALGRRMMDKALTKVIALD